MNLNTKPSSENVAEMSIDLLFHLLLALISLTTFKCPTDSLILPKVPPKIYRFSKHRPSGPMLSISRNVCLCVRLFVCPSMCSLLRYHLNVFLPSISKVGYPKKLKNQNPLEKVVERNGLRFEYSCLKLPRRFFLSHLFTFEVMFKRLFAPTSQSQMSNMLRDLESFEKGNGKKWSQIWPFFFSKMV